MKDVVVIVLALGLGASAYLLRMLTYCLSGEHPMNISEIVGFVLSVALMVYLTVALLKPEWFA
jgi:K+-transporting ATPase KdpF subunit